MGSPSGAREVSGEGRAPGWVRSGSSGSTRGAPPGAAAPPAALVSAVVNASTSGQRSSRSAASARRTTVSTSAGIGHSGVDIGSGSPGFAADARDLCSRGGRPVSSR